VRQARGRFGGQVTTDAKVTWTLVALNVICYIAEVAYPNFINDGEMLGKFGTHYGVANGEWYRLITNAFLHYPPNSGFGIFHILFNMWALIVVGPPLERVLGRVRFLMIYLVSALGGAVLYYFIASVTTPAIGASGAIFGLFGAFFVMARRMRANTNQIVGLIVLNLVIGFVLPNIGWQDHVGGLIAGGALAAAYAYAPKQNRTLVQVGATLAIVAILVLGVVLRNHELAHVIPY
jgi:membrane associated rhomboid family serine protease